MRKVSFLTCRLFTLFKSCDHYYQHFTLWRTESVQNRVQGMCGLWLLVLVQIKKSVTPHHPEGNDTVQD